MKAVDPFGGLSKAGRETLARGLAQHHFAKGTTVVEKGQVVSGAYFVLAGQLRVFTLTPGGKEATLYLIGPGETCVLAINSLFNNLLYPAWVQAESATTVGVVPGPTYRALFAREPPIQDLTVHALSTIVFRLMAELEQVHSCRLDQRLASFLLVRASGEGVLHKTQQEIAASIGTTREVVARLMADFAARGLVQTRRGRVTILRPPGLAAVVGEAGAGL
ncbi:MAG: Crp/Fnr family transcriptional regulator [Alphaproteobacteria bacterium]|nr:Crp/Fnr family transcriptional regulator [Alphaproteobacteria bacterium]MBF0393934.1 Crp/Fnr family transcriptional regulator [Alphaproteobacteria bacterium]